MLKKIIAGAAIALAATFTVSTAATAAPYTPEGGVTVSDPTVAPGQSTVLSFADGSFAPNDPVTITITGEDAANATLASFRTAPMAVTSNSITKNSTSAGGLRVTVTLPAGSYALTGTDTQGNTVSTTISVVAAAGNGTSTGGNSTGGNTADNAAGLPVTGGQIPVVLIWTGGGLLLLGAALVAVLATVRRQRTSL
jgi:hypothetical protein